MNLLWMGDLMGSPWTIKDQVDQSIGITPEFTPSHAAVISNINIPMSYSWFGVPKLVEQLPEEQTKDELLADLTSVGVNHRTLILNDTVWYLIFSNANDLLVFKLRCLTFTRTR